MKRALNIVVFLIAACLVAQFATQARAQDYVTETIQTLLQDMWRDYTDFHRYSNQVEKLDVAKRMSLCASTILTYYHQGAETETDMSITAEAMMLLSLVAYEVNDPTLTYHSLQIADSLDGSVFERKDPMTGKPFKERVTLMKKNWLPNFKETFARVYGFGNRITWDTLRVEIGIIYLERELREDKTFQAIDWAEDYLNSELRGGREEITLLLPPGNYRLNTEDLDIYPARFEVPENSPPVVFDITPDRYFNLRVYYCRDTTLTRIDSVVVTGEPDTLYEDQDSDVSRYLSERYPNYIAARVDTSWDTLLTRTVQTKRVPVSPDDIDIWKEDKKLRNLDHLAFGEYEFAMHDSFDVPEENRILRFLPEDQDWDMPKDERFLTNEVFVGDKDTYNYCIDLPRRGERPRGERGVPSPRTPYEDPCKLCRPRTPEKLAFLLLMAGTFVLFLNTIK
jgi:hypothetical protein